MAASISISTGIKNIGRMSLLKITFTLILFAASDLNKETSFNKSPESDGGKGLSGTQLSALIGGLCGLLIIILMVIFAFQRKAKRRKQLARNARPRR